MAAELATASPEQANEAAEFDMLATLGHQADSGEIDRSSIDIATTKPKSASSAAGEAPAKEKPAAESQPADESLKAQEPPPKEEGKGQKEEAPKPDEAKPEEPKETDYTRAKKEQERREKSWQQLEAEKAAFRAEREAFEKAKNGANPTDGANATPAKDSRGYTAEQYEQAAKDFAADGDTELAEQARQAAQTLRQKEQETTQQRQTQEQQQTWWKNANDVVAKEKDLQDLQTPLAKATKSLLDSEPAFRSMPNGFEKAVNVAKAQMQAAEVPALKTKIDQLTKELQAAQAKLTVDPGSVERPAREKSVSEMPLDEAERHVMSLASQYDQEFGGIQRS